MQCAVYVLKLRGVCRFPCGLIKVAINMVKGRITGKVVLKF